jgi:hypothetical protein
MGDEKRVAMGLVAQQKIVGTLDHILQTPKSDSLLEKRLFAGRANKR